MQRDRLDGWMVQQIAQANLAQATLIQLPPSSKAARGGASLGMQALLSPRHGHGGSPLRRRPFTAVAGATLASEEELLKARPATSPRRPMDALPRSPRAVSRASYNWGRLEDRNTVYEEHGHVDRTKALRDPHMRPQLEELEDDDEASPLDAWGLPREHILEYIRQSVMPTAWATNTRFAGEWMAVQSDAEQEDGHHIAATLLAASLPPLGSLPNAQTRRVRPSVGSQTAREISTARSKPHMSPLGIVTAAAMNPNASSASKSPRTSEDRIQRLLQDLRSDPALWAAFEQRVQSFQLEQRTKYKTADKIRENRQRISSPRAPPSACLQEKKKHAAERMERTRCQRERLTQHNEARLEAQWADYQRRVQPKKKPLSEAELALTAKYRRRRMWLLVVAFILVSTRWQRRLQTMKQFIRLQNQQTKAARTIQRLWRKWKWRHASKHTVLIYTWLRKCLWKLMFNVRCRRKARMGTILQRFMVDNFSGSRETRNFNCMMLKWRGKVIRSQRLGMAFINCTRARIQALSLWWDVIDHERQRQERQVHEKWGPSDGKEPLSWTGSRKLTKRISQANLLKPGTGANNGGAPGDSGFGAPRKAATDTIQQLEQIHDRLTSMRQILTPIELQRLQQHAFHIVRIPKSIKLRLLIEFLTTVRKIHVRALTAFDEQVKCASYTREVKLDDARAIVQNGASWGSLLTDRRASVSSHGLTRPTLQLYSGEKQRQLMEQLVRRGVELTLESDPEQRFIVERQKQQREKRESIDPLPRTKHDSTGSASPVGSDGTSPGSRKSTGPGRRLGFLLLTTNEKPINPVAPRPKKT